MTLTIPRRLVQAAAALALSLTAMPAQVAAEPTELIFNYYPPRLGLVYNEGIVPWMAAIEEASEGTLKITMPPAALGPPNQALALVEDGIADIGVISMIPREDQLSLYMLGDIPLISPSSRGAAIAAWKTHEAYFAEVDQFEGLTIPLTLWLLAPNILVSNGDPLLSAADFEGFKIHTEGSNRIQIFENLGATPVPGDGRAMFEFVSTGVADGTAQPIGPAAILGMPNASTHVTMVPGGIGRVPFGLVINRERFEELPEVAQKALLDNSGLAAATRIGTLWDGMDGFGRSKFNEAGIEIHTASDAFVQEIREASAFQIDAWLAAAEEAGIDGQAALDFYRKTAAENE